jgi:glycosyltransferase involved in cell wall biosynthesis
VVVLRNFVPACPEPAQAVSWPKWNGPVFLYFSRIDDNKNFGEFVAAVASAERTLGKQAFGIACGPAVPDYPVAEIIDRNQARGSVVVLPPAPYESSHLLFRSLRERRAVFVSPSKGESFGLSAAEAMTAGLPVVLSDIPPHSALVSGRKKFLYPVGNVRELVAKMAEALQHYDDHAAECVALSAAFSERAFLADWEQVLRLQPEVRPRESAGMGSGR